MRVAALGSGSRGNSVLVASGETRLLVDAGFSGRQLRRRMSRLSIPPESITAVVVTHEHRDHTSGIGIAARRWGWPLYMTPSTRAACAELLTGSERIHLLPEDGRLRIGSLAVDAFRTCHDAADPRAVTVSEPSTGLKVGVATDLGRATTPVRHALAGCHFLFLEANHDERRLRDGPYPWAVKQRIGGSRGHLSNRLAAELAVQLLHPGLVGVVLVHLSEQCNEPELARRTVAGPLARAGYSGPLHVARQDGPTELYDVGKLVARRGDRATQPDLFGPSVRSRTSGAGRS